MNSDGSDLHRLNDIYGALRPDFSPDGTKIAFFSDRDGPPAPEIYAMNTDGSSQTNLTNNAAFDFSPDWRVVAGGPGQPPPGPASKAACKNGGYKDFGFKNQGQCIEAVIKAS